MSYNSKSLKHCVTSTKDKLITLEENGKKIAFENNGRKVVKKVKVDGCAIKNGKKCDWLVVDAVDVEHFVELKGVAVLAACEQLAITIPQLSQDSSKALKHSYVICGRVAPQITSSLQIAKKKFKERFNSTLIVKQDYLLVSL